MLVQILSDRYGLNVAAQVSDFLTRARALGAPLHRRGLEGFSGGHVLLHRSINGNFGAKNVFILLNAELLQRFLPFNRAWMQRSRPWASLVGHPISTLALIGVFSQLILSQIGHKLRIIFTG